MKKKNEAVEKCLQELHCNLVAYIKTRPEKERRRAREVFSGLCALELLLWAEYGVKMPGNKA